METTTEICLWEKLIQMGFNYKEITIEISFMDAVKNFFGAKIKPKVKTSTNFLIKEINGKTVEVFGIDIWYTRATVDGVVVFDNRRFKDQELFDAINEATKSEMLCGVCNGDATICDGC